MPGREKRAYEAADRALELRLKCIVRFAQLHERKKAESANWRRTLSTCVVTIVAAGIALYTAWMRDSDIVKRAAALEKRIEILEAQRVPEAKSSADANSN